MSHEQDPESKAADRGYEEPEMSTYWKVVMSNFIKLPNVGVTIVYPSPLSNINCPKFEKSSFEQESEPDRLTLDKTHS